MQRTVAECVSEGGEGQGTEARNTEPVKRETAEGEKALRGVRGARRGLLIMCGIQHLLVGNGCRAQGAYSLLVHRT
jgi:hypothetical protein